MTPRDLNDWLKACKLTRDAGAAALGIHRATMYRYLSGELKIPRWAELSAKRYLSLKGKLLP